MTTLRGQLISQVAALMDTAHALNAGWDVTDEDRISALEISFDCARTPGREKWRREFLVTLAVDALLWVEQIDEARECRVDTGDCEEAA